MCGKVLRILRDLRRDVQFLSFFQMINEWRTTDYARVFFCFNAIDAMNVACVLRIYK